MLYLYLNICIYIKERFPLMRLHEHPAMGARSRRRSLERGGTYMYMYIYIERERDVCMYVYIYIYVYTYRERYYIYICTYIYIYIYICMSRETTRNTSGGDGRV